MNWLRAIVCIVTLWSSSAVAATLAWNANTEPDLAGYRIYQCNFQPCSPSSGNQSLLVTLGKVTTYNIGTPSATKYYYITAVDTANAESGGSNVVTYVPPTMTQAAPLSGLQLTVVGTPSIGAWGVEGSTTDFRDIMATVYLDGQMYLTDRTPPYSFPASSGFTTTGKFGPGQHKVEFVFYLENTATEVGRANVTVTEGTSPTPSSSVSLSVVGAPATGAWGVIGTTTAMRDVMANIYLDGKYYTTENGAPYTFPWDNATQRFGAGTHKVEFVFCLQNTTTEVGRASVTVVEGTQSNVSLALVGTPATGPWGVIGSTTDTRNVMADIYLDGRYYTTENGAPYTFPWDNATQRYGAGTHRVEFIFKLQDTTTEIGRSSITVQEGP